LVWIRANAISVSLTELAALIGSPAYNAFVKKDGTTVLAASINIKDTEVSGHIDAR
tara:strand:+ start:224 stop:391 length:168 start_codon:yes stop_codon:yes gene_type:complete